MVQIRCHACKKMFSKFPHEYNPDSYQFCSIECTKKPCFPVACHQCNKTYLVSVHSRSTAKYCSTECRNERNRQKQIHKDAPTVDLICEHCGKPFSVRRSIGRVQRYCSQKCSGIAVASRHTGIDSPVWKPKHKITCLRCNKEFETHESRSKRTKYCSRQCATLGHLNNIASGKRTDIEVAMAKTLRKNRIRFTEQVVMFDKFMVDFLLSDYQIIIQCDGRYWHDRPKTKARDTGQDRYLAKAGYTVLRFDDNQINTNIDACIKQIKHTIKNPNQIPLIQVV